MTDLSQEEIDLIYLEWGRERRNYSLARLSRIEKIGHKRGLSKEDKNDV